MGNILQFARCQTFMPCPKTAEPAHRALPSSRTPSRRFTYVKWGRRILRRYCGTCPSCKTIDCRDLLYVCPKIKKWNTELNALFNK